MMGQGAEDLDMLFAANGVEAVKVQHRTFVIDTGSPVSDFDPRSLVPDWFQDLCAPDIDTEKLFHDYAYHLIGATKNPVKMATVRDHALAQWRFLRHLAGVHPDIFDEFWTAYAERAQRFE